MFSLIEREVRKGRTVIKLSIALIYSTSVRGLPQLHLPTWYPAFYVRTTQQVPRRYLVGFFCQISSVFCTLRMFTLLLLSGGGIGGLTLAYALSKSPDIQVDIYEAASKFTEIGAGIGVYWRTRQILKSLELEDDVIRLLPFRPGQDRGELGECHGCTRH